jgi:hypothetical protein
MMALGSFLRLTLIGVVAASAAGCSSDGGLSTGTLIGGNSANTAKALPNNNTATGRALHVGSVSGRATKCGFNFDAAALRANYLAAEATGGTAVADLGKIEGIYDSGYRGVLSAAARDPNYCNSKRTYVIKTALNKALAGDYAPPPLKVKKDAGLFGGFLDQDVVEKGPGWGSEDWWEQQGRETDK